MSSTREHGATPLIGDLLKYFSDKKVSISTGQTWTNPSDNLPPLQPSWARKIETSSWDPEKL